MTDKTQPAETIIPGAQGRKGPWHVTSGAITEAYHHIQLTFPSPNSHLFLFCCLIIFLRLMIMEWRRSRPSCRPSPMMAQAGWRCQGVWEPSSFSANICSTSHRGNALRKSCLLATTNTGTPWFSCSRVILCSSVLASSMRSASTESTTNTRPSAQRVYERQSGRSFSWPPTSQKWKVAVRPFPPRVTLIFSVLKPLVGTVFTNSLKRSRYNTVVLPAQSKPRITICRAWKEGRQGKMAWGSDNPFPILFCHSDEDESERGDSGDQVSLPLPLHQIFTRLLAFPREAAAITWNQMKKEMMQWGQQWSTMTHSFTALLDLAVHFK